MYRFGWKRDLPDFRDYKYALHHEMQQTLALPPVMDLRPKMSAVEDQGDLGSCVAHATIGALEFLELQGLMDKAKVVPEEFGASFVDLSRMFVYNNARILDGDLDQDGGTMLRTAVRAISKWGICRETLWPYQDRLVFSAPSITAYQEAAKHLVSSGYYRLNHLQINELKQCLAQGFPFIFGISVYSSFMSHAVAQTGMVPMPNNHDSLEGGHALCCVGYDDSKSAFIVRNSWSSGWGDKGYCYLPYGYMTSGTLASDFWTLRNS